MDIRRVHDTLIIFQSVNTHCTQYFSLDCSSSGDGDELMYLNFKKIVINKIKLFIFIITYLEMSRYRYHTSFHVYHYHGVPSR